MAAPVLVQSATNSTGQIPPGALSVTTTLGATPTPGNLLVFVVIGGNAIPATAPTTVPSGLTEQLLNAITPDDGTVAIYSRVVEAGDGKAWTFGWGSSDAYGIMCGIMEWTAAVWDVGATTQPAAGSSISTGTINTGNPNEVVVSQMFCNAPLSTVTCPGTITAVWNNYQFGFGGSLAGATALGYVDQAAQGTSSAQTFAVTSANLQIAFQFALYTTAGAQVSAPTFAPIRMAVLYRPHKSTSLSLLTTPVPPPIPVHFRGFVNVNF